MKFLFLILSVCLVLASVSPVFAASNSLEYGAAFALNHGQGFQKYQLGNKTIVDDTREVKVQYDFSKSGGAVATGVPLKRPLNAAAGAQASETLPKNAIVTGCYIDVLTAPTSGGSATIALSTGKSAGDLLAATAYGSFTGVMACIPTGSAASSIKLTADVVPSMTIATAALTAGKFNVHIQYGLNDP